VHEAFSSVYPDREAANKTTVVYWMVTTFHNIGNIYNRQYTWCQTVPTGGILCRVEGTLVWSSQKSTRRMSHQIGLSENYFNLGLHFQWYNIYVIYMCLSVLMCIYHRRLCHAFVVHLCVIIGGSEFRREPAGMKTEEKKHLTVLPMYNSDITEWEILMSLLYCFIISSCSLFQSVEEYRLVGCYAMLSGRGLPMFQRNLLPPCSVSKTKLRQQTSLHLRVLFV
jgi:hypothetical protein